MPMLEVAAAINIPATVASRLLTDTRAWPQWGPSVRTVEATGPDSCRVTFTIPAWAPFYVPVCRAALRANGRLATRLER